MYYYFNKETADIRGEYNKPVYQYVWSQQHGSFCRYTDYIYDPHDNDPNLGQLVASLPVNRLPIRKILSSPMVFDSPVKSYIWLQDHCAGIVPTYDGKSMIGDMRIHTLANGYAINIEASTFPGSIVENYPFYHDDDGLVISVMTTNGDFVKIIPELPKYHGTIRLRTPDEVLATLAIIKKLTG